METLRGTLERIVYSNEEKQYLVAEFRPEDSKNKIIITGIFPGVQCGESLELKGEWNRHPRHGEQFRASSFEARLPSSVHGIRKYLGSGLIPGIGKTYAKKIVDHFGKDTMDIISRQSARLLEVPGIGKERARKIKEGWEEHAMQRAVLVFLQTYGISAAKCLRLVRQYGDQTEIILKNNPYRLANDMEGIGFKTADQIAVNLGIPSDSSARIGAGLLHALQMAADDGHTALPRGDLVSRSCELLGLSSLAVEPVLDQKVADGDICLLRQGTMVQRRDLARSEERMAKQLKHLVCAQSCLPKIDTDRAVEWAMEREGFSFAPEQMEALQVALRHPVSLLTGGPGTGKTTILRSLVAILTAKKVSVSLASPTGRAAQRMSEATGIAASTIHRLLQYDPSKGGFQYREERSLKCDFLIVDETSMLDVRLAASLVAAVRPGAHLLFVGDPDQLPSVGPGDVLRNLIQSELFPVVRLQRVYRQSRDSRIIDLAYQVLGGNTSYPYEILEQPRALEDNGDVQWIRADTPEACVDRVLRLLKYLPKVKNGLDPVRDVQVISPLHKGVAGVANLNHTIKEQMDRERTPHSQGSSFFSVGDKIIQNRNNYDLGIFNGDTGIVVATDKEKGTLEADFSGVQVTIDRGNLSDVALAYAITVHKSQGSEYPYLILPLMKQHFLLLRRNLIYTAITRGKKAVFFVGDPTAYSMAVRQVDDQKRSTDLVGKILA